MTGVAMAGGAMNGGEPDHRLLEMLVCPVTRTPLRYDSEAQELVSEAAGLAFPIRVGIPVMLVEEARPL
jgi:uncharacterized protein YbaR (Trm112 family)